MPSRLIMHPIFENKRSRLIFIIFAAISFGIGITCWIQISRTLEEAGLTRQFSMIQENTWARVLLSNYFQAALILVSAVIGTGLTARHVVGPIKRIEQWLGDWNNNLNPFPLLVRKGDKFSHLVDILNKLYAQSNKPPEPPAG